MGLLRFEDQLNDGACICSFQERMCYQFFVILMCRLFYFLEYNSFEVPHL